MPGPDHGEPGDRWRDMPIWRVERLEKAVDSLGERGDRRHEENSAKLGEMVTSTRMLAQKVEDLGRNQERALNEIRTGQERAVEKLREDQDEVKAQNDRLLRAILWLAGVVVVAAISVAFSWLRDVTTVRAHAEEPLPFEAPERK